MSAREANRKSQKLFPIVKQAEKHGSVPIHLNYPTDSMCRSNMSKATEFAWSASYIWETIIGQKYNI